MKYYIIVIVALVMTTCASSHVSQNSGNFEDLIKAGKDVLISQ